MARESPRHTNQPPRIRGLIGWGWVGWGMCSMWNIVAELRLASRRRGAVLRTHAELGLSAPGNAEPQLGV